MLEKKHKPKRVFIPGPDRRNVARGKEWLRKMIQASEEKKSMDKVVAEMTGNPERQSDEL
jgi:hypothetical protein